VYWYGVRTGDTASAGKLVFVDPSSLSIVREVAFPGTSVLRIVWHARLNQIFVSDGNGGTHVHYAQGLSQKGALLCANKAVSKKKFSGAYMSAEVAPEIHNPHALPLYKSEAQKKAVRKRGDTEVHPSKKTEPQRGYGSEAGNATASSFTEYIMREAAKDSTTSGNLRREDPRAALLKHAAAAEANPTWISKAYAPSFLRTRLFLFLFLCLIRSRAADTSTHNRDHSWLRRLPNRRKRSRRSDIYRSKNVFNENFIHYYNHGSSVGLTSTLPLGASGTQPSATSSTRGRGRTRL